MDQQTLLISCCIGVALVAAVVAAFPSIFGDDVARQRQDSIRTSGPKRASSDRVVDQATRRKQITDSLKEVENKSRSKKASLETRISQAGLDWSRNRFLLTSLGFGVVLALVIFVVNGSILISVLALVVGVLGVPNWALKFLLNRRLKQFRVAFPDALDIIIRGVKAGLPLGDCLRIIASEASEPVRSEFRQIVQSQAIGLGVGEAVERMAERVPMPELSFFSIVINIQQKAGGNLSESLANLSRVSA